MPSTVPSSRRTLTYGLDAALLGTRKMLLQQSGYRVDLAGSAQQFAASIASAKHPYALYILCHTIPKVERNEISEAARQSGTPVYSVEPLASPVDFLRHVAALLA